MSARESTPSVHVSRFKRQRDLVIKNSAGRHATTFYFKKKKSLSDMWRRRAKTKDRKLAVVSFRKWPGAFR